MEEADLEPEAPNAGPSRGQGSHGDNGSDSGEEAAPDYGLISSLAAKARQQQGIASEEAFAAPYIPKRGEKDFEPTGFEAQGRALEKSRKAMFDVIRCERVVASKNVSIAMWEPSLNRAVVELARGSLFSSIGITRKVAVLKSGLDEDLERYYQPNRTDWQRDGVWKEGKFYEKTRSRLELLPEEALFLVERGSLECRVRVNNASKEGRKRAVEKTDYDVEQGSDGGWVPMSVQQAFATMLFKDDLTRERYQLYANLKRLGYIVQRASLSDSLRLAAASKRGQLASTTPVEALGVVADPNHPLKLVTILDVLFYPLRRFRQLCFHGFHRLASLFMAGLRWLRSIAFRTTRASSSLEGGHGRGLLGLGGKKWARYEEVFDRLRIVPTGHDTPLRPRHPLQSQGNDEVPEIFFYAWRPATRFKRTDPPLPEYRLAVVDARKTSVPSAFAFESLFANLPIPLTGDRDLEEMDEEEQREWQRAQEERKRNDESYGKGAVKKLKASKEAAEREKREQRQSQQGMVVRFREKVQRLLQRFVALLCFVNHCYTLLPPGCASPLPPKRVNPAPGARPRPVNVFPLLKTGRRDVIVAVNDCGTTSLIRFGEAEFSRWRLAGTGRV